MISRGKVRMNVNGIGMAVLWIARRLELVYGGFFGLDLRPTDGCSLRELENDDLDRFKIDSALMQTNNFRLSSPATSSPPEFGRSIDLGYAVR